MNTQMRKVASTVVAMLLVLSNSALSTPSVSGAIVLEMPYAEKGNASSGGPSPASQAAHTSTIYEEFDSADGFTSTDPDVYIQDGKVHWHVSRSEGEQYVYRSIPSFTGAVRLTVTGQVDGATNNCGVSAGIGDGYRSGIGVSYGFYGGGCSTHGYVIRAGGADLDYSESHCVFTGNWLWINSGTQYTATLTLEGDEAELSVPGIGSSSGTPTYDGAYNTLYVGTTGGGDWPSCWGTIERMVIEPLNGGTLPDFDIPMLSWSPTEPETMEAAGIDFYIRNLGEDYTPDQGTAEIELNLRDTSTGDELQWIFPGELSALPSNDWTQLSIDPYLFTSADIDEIEACLSVDDPESDTSNNCRTESITVVAPEKPWRSCVGMLIGVIEAAIEATPVDEVYEAIKGVSRIYATHAPNMVVQCQVKDEHCIRAGVFFLVDSGITLARVIGEATVLQIISIGRLMIQQAIESYHCGDHLGSIVRMWVENSKHRNIDVNAAVAQSPVYIRIVDSSGQRAGFLDDGSVVTEIPGADVFETNGDKVVLCPGTDMASVEITGTDTGEVDLIVALSRESSQPLVSASVRSQANAEVHTVIYKNVPVYPTTTGEIQVASGNYYLSLDDNGDGTPDRSVQPDEETRTAFYYAYLPQVMRNN